MLGILGLVAIIAITVQIYRTAKDNGRNAVGWTLLSLGVGFGLQFVIPLLIGFVIGIVMAVQGSSPEQIMSATTSWKVIVISIFFMVLSVAAVYLIFRHVSKIPEDENFVAPPAPPENFN